jgi:sugar transferase (PEP-CTERM system associated)
MTIRLFRHHVPTPLFLLALVEVAIFFGSVYGASAVRFAELDVYLHRPTGEQVSVLPRALVYTVVMIGVMTAMGLYRWQMRLDDLNYRVRYLGAFLVGLLILLVLFYAIPQTFVGRGVMLLSLLFSFTLSAIARQIFFRAVGTEAFKRRVLVLGTGSRAAEVGTLHQRLGEHAGFVLVGFVPFRNEQSAVDKSKLIRQPCPLIALAHRLNVHEIVVGIRDRRNTDLSMPELLECKLDGVNVIDLSSFFERETGHVQLNSLNTSWMVYSEGFRRNAMREVVKRIFDVVVSLTLLMLTLPVMLVTALAILIDDGLPILYRQSRVGECGQNFKVLKFRSMRIDAEKDGVARWAQKNDNRVTRVGRFIRTTRIDELPQIFNVLKGDMSFVGPRPERPQFVTELTRQISYYPSRHSVKPGITGWAQIRYPYGASVEDAMKKLQYDLYYVKNHTLFLDLVVLFQTAQVVLFGRGAR